MQSPETFRIFTRRLESLGVPYMVTGSVAAIYYGEPRMTNDVDIVVLLKREDAKRIEAGFQLEEFYCPPCEIIEMEVAREQRGHFNLIHHQTGFKADIYLVGRDELHLWAMSRAQVVELGDDIIRIAPPEYVIVRKLQFFREGGSEKHVRDIDRMLESLGGEWSRETLLDLVRSHGLEAEWDQVPNSSASD